MALTFGQMAQEAYAAVPSIGPQDAYRRMQDEPTLLLIDVRDSAEIAATGTIAGAARIPYSALTYGADTELPAEWRNPELQDRTRPLITTCILGPVGALAGKLLHDMGFTDVRILEGGVQAWKEDGLPMA